MDMLTQNSLFCVRNNEQHRPLYKKTTLTLKKGIVFLPKFEHDSNRKKY